MKTEQSGTEPRLDSPPAALNRRMLTCAGVSLFALVAVTCFCYQARSIPSPFGALREVVHSVLAVGTIVAFVLGYRVLRAAPDSASALPVILGFGAAFSVIALFARPTHSHDAYCYINTGWLQVEYGVNPYMKAPNDVSGWQQDPMIHPVWHVTKAAYGFLFTSITRLLCWLGRGDPWATLMLFKAMNAAAFALTAWVIWLGCNRLELPHPERAMYLLLWNPLLLFHGIANGHNDLLMALMTAAGIYLAIRGAWLWVLPAIMAGVLIKMGSVVVLPFAFLYLVKSHGWTRALVSAGLGLLLAAASASPYLATEGVAVLRDLGQNATEVHNSLASLVFFPFEVCVKPFPWLKPYEGTVTTAIKLGFLSAFAAVYGHLAWRRLTGGGYPRSAFVRDCLLLQFVLICLVSSKYFAWYLGMIFPLALWLSSDDWLHRALVAFSCAQILAMTFIEQSHGLNAIVMILVPLHWALRPGSFTLADATSFFQRPHFLSFRKVTDHEKSRRKSLL